MVEVSLSTFIISFDGAPDICIPKSRHLRSDNVDSCSIAGVQPISKCVKHRIKHEA